MSRTNVTTGRPFGDEFGYSRAVRVGDHIHIAGTCAQPPHDHGDAYQQAKSALAIIEGALAELGAGLDDVVRNEAVGGVVGDDFGGADVVDSVGGDVDEAVDDDLRSDAVEAEPDVVECMTG